MLERHSALASAKPYVSSALKIAEADGFSLLQAAGLSADFEDRLRAAIGEVPSANGRSLDVQGRTVMRIGPAQFWLVGPPDDAVAAGLAEFCAATPLTAARTRILLDGQPARAVLAKGIALDFHPQAFTPGTFAQTGLHHMPLLLQCVGENAFHLYALRTFALSTWDWLTDAALEFAA